MINIELEHNNRKEVTPVLNNLLSDEYLLSTKTKNYHWNVTGPHFHDLHVLFGDQYAELDVLINHLGERVRALGGNAFGTMTEFLRCTRLQERPGVHPNALTMAEDLYDDQKILLRSLRGSLAGNDSLRNDIGTTQLLTGAIQKHEKMAAMLQSALRTHDQLNEWLKAQENIQREIGIEVLAPAGSAT
jgi:starvation-inducible DNA-binding protein